MTKGFVFGKFLPFHKGHQAMIEFALEKCDLLSVLICASDKENISGDVRKKWIEETFKTGKKPEVLLFNYKEEELINSSVPSREASNAWAKEFKKVFPLHTVLVTSEVYGDYVADAMGIKHIPFDLAREIVPCSASMIRNDIQKCWNYLPASVKPYYCKKIVILGTESTGKSTLSKNLASHFNATLVAEAGRDLIEDSNEFTVDDLYKVANEHARRIEEAAKGESALIVIDTDVHITQSYARCFFKKPLVLDEWIYDSNKADLYLYLCNDVPHVQDGTRMQENERNLLDKSHRETLALYTIDFIEIKGSWENRLQNAIQCIEALKGKDS